MSLVQPLENGYYLSVYGMIDELAFLSNNYVRHDFAIALWYRKEHDITLTRYWEMERLTGYKSHDCAFYNKEQFEQIMCKLLDELSLKLSDIKQIWGIKQYSDCSEYYSLDRYGDFAYHTLGHLFSALLIDTTIFQQKNILALSVDGGPDNLIDYNFYKKKFYAGAYVSKGKVIDVFGIYSPGGLWDYVSKYYKLREGSLMALASASKSKLKQYKVDSSLWIHNKQSSLMAEMELLRLIQYVENDAIASNNYNEIDERFTLAENKISMVMKVIQQVSLEIMSKNIENAIKHYAIQPCNTYLAISGGFGLNCPCNSFLMNKYSFKGFIAPPCVNDSGMALGIGLYAFYRRDPAMNFTLRTAYFGNSDRTLEETLQKYDHFIEDIQMMDRGIVVQDIINGPIVWFDGASEIGPRALGHRSLLADPRSSKAKDQLNKIKKRQWWRPVAPIVIEKEVKEWFLESYQTPFMLHTFYVKGEKAEQIPAVLHLDGSARVQTINESQNPSLYNILEAFYKQTNVPILCNTSLNDRSEPIIDNIDQMFNFSLRKRIGVVYVNGVRVSLRNYGDYRETKPASRLFNWDNYLTEEERVRRMEELNPIHCDDELISFYVRNPNLREKNNIADIEDIKKIKKMKIMMEGVQKNET